MLRGIAQFTFKLHEEENRIFRSFTSKYSCKVDADGNSNFYLVVK
jgi:hypothetical protein